MLNQGRVLNRHNVVAVNVGGFFIYLGFFDEVFLYSGDVENINDLVEV